MQGCHFSVLALQVHLGVSTSRPSCTYFKASGTLVDHA